MTIPDLVETISDDPGWIVVNDEIEADKAETDDFLRPEPVRFRANCYFDSSTDPADKFILIM